MNKNSLQAQRGYTLIEVLAVLIILSFIMLLVTPLIVKSMDHYENIQADTVLRDEADLILASLFKTLYTTKESEIQTLTQITPDINNPSFDYFTLTDGSIIGFKDGQFHAKDTVLTTANSSVQLITAMHSVTDYSKITKINDHTYRVTLVLKNNNKNKTHIFENDITTIDDKITE